MAEQMRAKWIKGQWQVGELIKKESSVELVTSDGRRFKVKETDSALVNLDSEPLVNWFIAESTRLEWPASSEEIVLEALRIAGRPLSVAEIKKEISKLKLENPNFKEDFEAIVPRLKANEKIVVGSKPQTWFWTEEPQLLPAPRKPIELLRILLKTKNTSDDFELLKTELLAQEANFNDLEVLVSWAMGFSPKGPEEFRSIDVATEFIDVVFAALLTKPGIKSSLTAELLFGLEAKQSLKKKALDSFQYPLAMTFWDGLLSSGAKEQQKWLLQNVESFISEPQLFTNIVSAQHSDPDLSRIRAGKLQAMLDHLESGALKLEIDSVALFDAFDKAIFPMGDSIDPKFPRRFKTLLEKIDKTIPDSQIKASKSWAKLNLADWSLLMSDGDIQKRFVGPNFREFALAYILKSIEGSRSRNDLGYGLLMPSAFIADLSEALKSLAKRASSQDGTVRQLLHDELLEVQLDEAKSELNECLERISTLERNQSHLDEENARLLQLVNEFEQSRISARVNDADTSTRANEIVEVAVVRKWVATLAPIFKEIERIQEPLRDQLKEKLNLELELRGLTPIGQIDQVVAIDPLRHDVLGVSTSGQGQVIELGWMWKGNESQIVISKAMCLPH